jgi:hypothetical protein
MRRQTLVLVPIAGALLAVMLGLSAYLRASARRAMDPGGARTVTFGSASLPLPAAFRSAGARTRGAWTLQEFKAPGVGTLLLSSEPLDGSAFEAACQRWFSLPAWPAGPLIHRGPGGDRFFKPLPIFRQGALELHKERKSLQMTACFDAGGHRHWVELATTQGFSPEHEVFNALLLSLRDVEGHGPGADLGAALAAVPRETSHRFLLPLETLLAFPVMLLLLPSLITWVVGRRQGRLPQADTPLAASFRRPFVEVGIVGGGQRKFFLACVTVVDGDLLLHTFGTLFLRVPRAAHAGRATVGRGLVNPPYLELPLAPPAEFLKRRWLYGLAAGRIRLRLYTADLDALRVALGS